MYFFLFVVCFFAPFINDVTAVVAFLYPYDADSATSTATVVVNDVDETLNK